MSKKCTQYQQVNLAIVAFLADIKSASNVVPNNNCSELIINQLLQIRDPYGIMSIPAREKAMLDFSEKEEKVKELYDFSRIKVRPDDGRIYLVVKRKPVTSTSYIGLIEKLYDLHYNVDDITMQQYFEVWMEWRAAKTGVTVKTRKENHFLWNALLRDTELINVPLKTLAVEKTSSTAIVCVISTTGSLQTNQRIPISHHIPRMSDCRLLIILLTAMIYTL